MANAEEKDVESQELNSVFKSLSGQPEKSYEGMLEKLSNLLVPRFRDRCGGQVAFQLYGIV